MSSLFNAITGAASTPALPEAAAQPNPATATNPMDDYLNNTRQRIVNMQVLGGRLSPFQNALNTYDQFAGTPLPPVTVGTGASVVQPVRSPEVNVAVPPPGQMPAPSPLLQSGGGKKELMKMILKMVASGG